MMDRTDRGQLPINAIWTFLFAGNAIFTVQSPSGKHRTFKVIKVKNEDYAPIWSVMALVGPDNTSSYRNIGYMSGNPSERNIRFKGSVAYTPNHPLIEAFVWVLNRAHHKNFATKQGNADVYHEGRCGRCGRRLTVPDSVKRGLGPHCALRMMDLQ